MHLQQEVRAGALEFPVEFDHGEFDDVGGGALDGHVVREAFAGLAQGAVGGNEFRDVAAAAVQRLHIPVLAAEFEGAVDVPADAGVGVEVRFDESGGVGVGDAQVAAEAVGAHAVQHAEVHGLGGAALVGGDGGLVESEDLRGGAAVNVRAFLEGLLHQGVVGDVCQEAQFDL